MTGYARLVQTMSQAASRNCYQHHLWGVSTHGSYMRHGAGGRIKGARDMHAATTAITTTEQLSRMHSQLEEHFIVCRGLKAH